jgi:hypothetical protein
VRAALCVGFLSLGVFIPYKRLCTCPRAFQVSDIESNNAPRCKIELFFAPMVKIAETKQKPFSSQISFFLTPRPKAISKCRLWQKNQTESSSHWNAPRLPKKAKPLAATKRRRTNVTLQKSLNSENTILF